MQNSADANCQPGVPARMDAKTQQQQLKFVAESCLGKLSRHLRLLGIDCAWDKSFNMHYVLFLARQENRIVLFQSAEFLTRIERGNKMCVGMEGAPLCVSNSSGASLKEASEDALSDEDDFLDSIPAKYQQFVEQQRVTVGQQQESPNGAVPEWSGYRYYRVDKNLSHLGQLLCITNFFKIRSYDELLFRRCLKCNSVIVAVPLPEDEVGRAQLCKEMGQDAFSKYATTVTKCINCNKLFWQGHYYQKCVNFAQKYSYCDQPASALEAMGNKQEAIDCELTVKQQ